MKKKLVIPALVATLIGGAVVGDSMLTTAFASNNVPARTQEEGQKKKMIILPSFKQKQN